MLSSQAQAVMDDLLPAIRASVEGSYAVAMGGSTAKGTSDSTSDLDPRLFYARWAPEPGRSAALAAQREAIARWAERGVIIDGVWPRPIAGIQAELDRWLDGKGQPQNQVWTIWGYHLLTDLYHMQVIEDPDGVAAGWQQALAAYPPRLKAALLERHVGSLRYWRQDYHYQSKVRRKDRVFCAGIASRLAHDCLQVLFALNETYYVGDGANLTHAKAFEIAPPNLVTRVGAILYPGEGDQALSQQYERVLALIDDVLALV